jgi:hypothetical protein
MEIGTYKAADALLGDKMQRALPGKDTYLVAIPNPLYEGGNDPENEPDSIAVAYSGSKLIIYQDDGSVLYQHCGWLTETTISRFNSYGRDGVTVRKWRDDLVIKVGGGEPVIWEGYAVQVHADGQVEQMPTFEL